MYRIEYNNKKGWRVKVDAPDMQVVGLILLALEHHSIQGKNIEVFHATKNFVRVSLGIHAKFMEKAMNGD